MGRLPEVQLDASVAPMEVHIVIQHRGIPCMFQEHRVLQQVPDKQ
jgi:hypothetical protein